MLAPLEVIFSGHNQNMRKSEFFNYVRVLIEKQVSEIQKKCDRKYLIQAIGEWRRSSAYISKVPDKL